jgi:hypothetical protein
MHGAGAITSAIIQQAIAELIAEGAVEAAAKVFRPQHIAVSGQAYGPSWGGKGQQPGTSGKGHSDGWSGIANTNPPYGPGYTG